MNKRCGNHSKSISIMWQTSAISNGHSHLNSHHIAWIFLWQLLNLMIRVYICNITVVSCERRISSFNYKKSKGVQQCLLLLVLNYRNFMLQQIFMKTKVKSICQYWILLHTLYNDRHKVIGNYQSIADAVMCWILWRLFVKV